MTSDAVVGTQNGILRELTAQVARLADELSRLNDLADERGYPSRAAVAGSTVSGASKCTGVVHIFAWGSRPGEACDCGVKTWAA